VCLCAPAQVAQERTEAAESRSRELYKANKRLESHVHDLESRKRAPLYQKKQEVGEQVLLMLHNQAGYTS